MSVFIWNSPDPRRMLKEASHDEVMTARMTPKAECQLCGERFLDGERVMGWQAPGGGILAHARCVGEVARGLIKDVGECLRDVQ